MLTKLILCLNLYLLLSGTLNPKCTDNLFCNSLPSGSGSVSQTQILNLEMKIQTMYQCVLQLVIFNNLGF
jgi:hypothetical protein